ncbi:MAG: Gldg family protein [Patescibacteria group bacterium]|nr:Gldg family protein [Patescibacteria group bacterium]
MKNILIVIKKELRVYFNNPTAYIVIVAFLLLWEFLFFRNVFLVGQASLRVLFDFLPWIFLIVIPALTMGSIAQEKSEGTLEFILTRPINEIELLIGKFLGSLIFIAIMLIFVAPIVWSLNSFGNFDTGIIIGQYIAGMLLGAVLISLGIFVSSLFSSQISAMLTAVVAGFFLIISGFEIFTSHLPLSFIPFFEQLSVLSHFNSMARGVIDIRDVWYFASISTAFLSLAYLMLLRNKFGNRHKNYRNYQLGIMLFVCIMVITNVIGSRIPGRIDLTEGKAFTLSHSTKKIVSQLDDIVDITFFASEKLPAQLQPVLREVNDVLRDYQTIGKGNIVVTRKNPSTDENAVQEAASLGVQEIRFNIVSQEEFQVKTGYLGLAVSYGGEHESMPFIENTSDLEYQLTSFIKKLTTDDKKTLVFISGHGEKSLSTDARLLKKELEKQFNIDEISPMEETSNDEPLPSGTEKETEKKTTLTIPESTDVIVVAGPKEELSQQTTDEIKKFISNGGNALFLVDGIDVMVQLMSAAPAQSNINSLLEQEYGVKVNSDLIYDLQSNETVSFGGGPVQYLLPYPFWIRSVRSSGISPITSNVNNITFPWASSITVNKNTDAITELLSTTEAGGTQTGQINISPEQKFMKEDLKQQLLAVAATIDSEKAKSRIVVVGDSDFITDQCISNNVENLAFTTDALSWLAQEDSLAEIQLKNKTERKLVFEDKNQPSLIKYGNMAFAFTVPLLFGGCRLMKRKKMKQRNYEQ